VAGSPPRGADVGLLVALAELTDGYLTDTVTWLYRRHAGSMTAHPDSDERVRLLRTTTDLRVGAIRSLGLHLAGARSAV
jgi:hypothetical protein